MVLSVVYEIYLEVVNKDSAGCGLKFIILKQIVVDVNAVVTTCAKLSLTTSSKIPTPHVYFD